MARGQFAWSPVKPMEVSRELAAGQSALNSLGGIYEDMGNTFDKMLAGKKTRDTADLMAEINALGTPFERQQALEEAQRDGFNFLDMPQVNEAMRATELHDFARNQEERNIAAADLLQKKYAADIENERTRALEAQQKHSLATDVFLSEEAGRETEEAFKKEQELQKTITAINDRAERAEGYDRADMIAENRLNWEKEQAELKEKIRLENEPFRTAEQREKIAELGDKNRIRINKENIRKDLKQIALTKNNYTNTVLTDENGKRILPEIAEFSELTDIIQNRKDQGFSNETLKPLINKYDKLLTDDKEIRITDDDLITAFGSTTVDYSPAGKQRLKDAVYSRLSKDYIHSSETALNNKVDSVFAGSRYVEKYDNKLLIPFESMEKALTPNEKTGVVNKQSIYTTYLKERKILSKKFPKLLKEFDSEFRRTALNAVPINIDTIVSKSPTVATELDPDGQLVKTKTLQNIIDKSAGDLTSNDLKLLNNSITQQLQDAGFKNIKQFPQEVQRIQNLTYDDLNLTTKIATSKNIIAGKLKIKAEEQAELVKQAGIKEKEQTKLKEIQEKIRTTSRKSSVKEGVRPEYVAMLKARYGKDADDILPADIDAAIDKLDNVLKANSNFEAGTRGLIIDKFLKSATGLSTYAGDKEVTLDWDENGQIETGSWPFGDQEIVDIPESGNIKLFRMLMDKGGADRFSTNATYIKEAQNNIIKQQKSIIQTNKNRIAEFEGATIFGKLPAGTKQLITALKKEISKAEAEVKKQNKKILK